MWVRIGFSVSGDVHHGFMCRHFMSQKKNHWKIEWMNKLNDIFSPKFYHRLFIRNSRVFHFGWKMFVLTRNYNNNTTDSTKYERQTLLANGLRVQLDIDFWTNFLDHFAFFISTNSISWEIYDRFNSEIISIHEKGTIS